MVATKICFSGKDTHRKKARSNETPALTNSMTFGLLVHQINSL